MKRYLPWLNSYLSILTSLRLYFLRAPTVLTLVSVPTFIEGTSLPSDNRTFWPGLKHHSPSITNYISYYRKLAFHSLVRVTMAFLVEPCSLYARRRDTLTSFCVRIGDTPDSRAPSIGHHQERWHRTSSRHISAITELEHLCHSFLAQIESVTNCVSKSSHVLLSTLLLNIHFPCKKIA